MLRTSLLVGLLALSAGGCVRKTTDLCEEEPGHPDCVAVDAGGGDGGDLDAGRDGDAGGEDAGPCPAGCAGATPMCRESDGMCVACLGDADCTDAAAARCELATGTCAPCDDSGQCAGIGTTLVCATAGAMTGACVECVDNTTCGVDEGCQPEANTCRSYTPGSAGACTACVADAECRAGMLCVQWSYDDPRTPAMDPVPAGTQCAWRQDASGAGAPNGDCVTIRPYVRAEPATSVDGEAATVCTLAQSTCAAQEDFRATDCMTLDAAGDARCGLPGVGDGVCRMFGAATNRCTVFCGSHDDCRMGFNCDSGMTPGVCRFM